MLLPTGDIYLGPGGNDVLPYTLSVNLGLPQTPFLSLSAREVNFETIVAREVIATVGGMLNVTPTTKLAADLAPAATTISVEHNFLAINDHFWMSDFGKFEAMVITGGPRDGGPYTYDVTRNLDGTGANQWYIGDALMKTGATGDGHIQMYADHAVHSATQYGPTIAFNKRDGATWNQIGARAAAGNLNGLYGYGTDIYGFAAGDPNDVNVTIDETNGIRMRDAATTVRGHWHVDGSLSVGAESGSHLYVDTSGNLSLRNGTTEAISLSTAGVITVKGFATAGNLLRDPDFPVGGGEMPTVTWASWTNSELPHTRSFWISGTWNIPNHPSAYSTLTGTPTADHAQSIYQLELIPVIHGQRYEASGYLGQHRGDYAYIALEWFDSTQTYMNITSAGNTTTASGGDILAEYERGCVVATAPTGALETDRAAFVRYTAVQNLCTTGGGACENPYLFLVNPYFGEAGSTQTTCSPYSGSTVITGGGLRTGDIRAANLNIGSGGVFRSGATAYDTGTGWWMDYNAGTPRFRIGNPAGNRMQWNGTTLTVVGDIDASDITSSTIDSSTAYFGGSNEVTLDNNGIGISAGSGVASSVSWTDGSEIYSSGDYAQFYADGSVNMKAGSYELRVQSGGTISCTGCNIGSGTDKWAAAYLSGTAYIGGDIDHNPGDTTNDYNPVVFTGTVYAEKTDGQSGQCDTINSTIDVEGGIVTGCTLLDANSPPPSTTRQEVASLRSEIAELRAELASLRVFVDALYAPPKMGGVMMTLPAHASKENR